MDRAATPEYVVWELTLQCDLACRHCGSRAGRARPDELSTEEALDLVAQMADMGVKEITVIGGEAYLREDWQTIVRAITDAGIEVGMTTGGRGITPELARQALDCGIDGISVSVDGLRETHDHLRAVKGAYDQAMKALQYCKDAGIHIAVNTQICRPTLHEMEPLLEVLSETGIHAWQVQLTVAMGRAADHPELLLQPFQMIEVMPMVARVARRSRELGIRLWPGTNVGYFGPYESLIRDDMPHQHGLGCHAGKRGMGIEANGDLKGCPSLPTDAYAGGNVRDNSVRDVWERAAPMRFNRTRGTEDLWGHCATCYYADVCKAGCTWTGHVLFGRRGNNPYCHHRALELLRAGRRERIEPATPAEGQPFDHGTYALIEEDWPAQLLPRAHELAASGEGWLPAES